MKQKRVERDLQENQQELRKKRKDGSEKQDKHSD